jgi:flavodoxin
MKTAILYYSLDGSCQRIAEALAPLVEGDLYRIRTQDEKTRTGVAKFFWGGRQVLMHQKPALQPLNFAAEDYDRIILGVPVWASQPAPPLTAFLEAHPFQGKQVALFATFRGSEGQVFTKLRELLGGNTILAQKGFQGVPDLSDDDLMRQLIALQAISGPPAGD